MRIESITLRELEMRLKSPFETSFGVTQKRRILLVEIIADGVSGWGEVTTTEAPFYNYETTDTAWHVISDFITPRLIGRGHARRDRPRPSRIHRWYSPGGGSIIDRCTSPSDRARAIRLRGERG